MADRETIDLEDLGARAKRREPLALAQLFDVFFEKLRRYAFYQTGDLDRAEDIAADTIRAAIESIDHFDDRGGMLGAWLYGIARNLVARQFREQGLKQEVNIDDLPLTTDDLTEEAVLRDLSYVELYEAISRLPGEQREVIILRYVEGYRSRAVGLIMGKKSGAVRGLQHRAILGLRKALQASGAAPGPGQPGAPAGNDSSGLGSSNAK
ncbi:MAG: sigma-70 family RNA polymerase sigma factor [Candidatus Geothermincolia bacterium]